MEQVNFRHGIIINADDLGWNQPRDRGILELLQSGKISSATTLVNGYNSKNSLQICRQKNFQIGLHLNLTEGRSLNQHKPVQSNTLVKLQKWVENDDSPSLVEDHLMLGQSGFRDSLHSGLIEEIDIQNEIRAQIDCFIELYGTLPAHIDGHQHVQTIPRVAKILAKIMQQQYGIYQIRIAVENLELMEQGSVNSGNQALKQFYYGIRSESEISKQIYRRYNIFTTDMFMGLTLMGKNMSIERVQKYLKYASQQFESEKQVGSIEFMCHVGYPTKNFGCQFSKSEDRKHEKELIESPQFEEILTLLNFQLQNFGNLRDQTEKSKKKSVLIYSQLSPGTGNQTTALRIQKILSQKFNVYMRSISAFKPNCPISIDLEIEEIKKLIECLSIDIILGINVYRTGLIFEQLNFTMDTHQVQLVPLLAGTDANVFMQEESSKKVMKNTVKNCSLILSLNEPMKNIFLKNFEFLEQSKIIVIPQSVDMEKSKQKEELDVRKFLGISEDSQIILSTASIRQVKDVIFPIKPLGELFREAELELSSQLYFYHVGPVLEENYHTLYLEEIEQLQQEFPGKFNFLGRVEYELCLNLIKQSDVMINTSVCEGLPLSLLEGISLGIPVVARQIQGNESVITHGVDGLLFVGEQQFQACILSILNNKGLRDSIIKQGIKTSQNKFSAQSEKLKYFDALESL